ncbi:MAG: hypothetical protein RIB59_01175 [Rhodospirillales bacterium]
MTRELRKIVFSEEQVQAAVVNHCLRTERSLPQANIETVEITDDPGRIVTFTYAQDNGAKTVEFDRDQVGAALILYCKNQEIPLPRAGMKVLKKEGESLAMMISLDLEKKRGGNNS